MFQMGFMAPAGELGDVKGLKGNKGYSGVALTLIDALSTLVVIGDAKRFQEAVSWLTKHVGHSNFLAYSCTLSCSLLVMHH